MQQDVVVIQGNTFMVSDALGDVQPADAAGLFCADTRFLSHYELKVNGERPRWLDSRSRNHFSASFYLTNPPLDGQQDTVLSIIRERVVGDGLHDELILENFAGRFQELAISLRLDADFADVFEARSAHFTKKGAVTRQQRPDGSLCFTYRRGRFVRQTVATFSCPASLQSDGLVEFRVALAPGERWQLNVDVLPVLGERESAACQCGWVVKSRLAQGLTDWLENTPSLRSSERSLQRAYGRAVRDLASLRLSVDGHLVPAAGMPWYMAVFGRDSLITGFQSLLIGDALAVGVLHVLARHQGAEINTFREEEPGKILHEIRTGELAVVGDEPHSTYYGSVDATPLFLILLAETYRWTQDEGLLVDLLPAADAALRWIDRYGDLDGDGFVEYSARSPRGLSHQGWKDSVDPIRFADGRQAQGPIAVAEVQGYVYDARRRMAGIYASLGRKDRALELQQQADQLKAQFDQAFWMPQEGYYALALDGAKRQVDSVTSNPGHCMWSGIVETSRAAAMAERVLAPDMFSGWGVRTMSRLMKGFNPLSYHNGSVWPHDSVIVAAGLARYGFGAQARRILEAVLQASAFFPDHRLPELFAGFAREEDGFPVRYPTACSPQAWAAGAVLHLIRTLLGAEPDGGHVRLDPLPGSPQIAMQGVWVGGRRVDLSTSDERVAAVG